MRKLLQLAAALTAFTLILAGCPEPSTSKPTPKPTGNVTGIQLQVTREGSDPSTTNPQELENGTTRTFSAVVTGTGTFDATYSINIEFLDETPNTAVSVTNGQNGAKVVTGAANEGKIKINAVSTGKTSSGDYARASWEIDLVEYIPPEVTGITLRVARVTGSTTPSATKPSALQTGAVRIFSAVVQGRGEFDLGYTIAVTGDATAVAEGTTGAQRVTITGGAGGTITVTATSTGTDLADPPAAKTAEWQINLIDPPAPPDLSGDLTSKWKVVNTRSSTANLNTGTTDAVPTADGRKRYVVFNNEPNALIDQDGSLAADGNKTNPNSFKDVTIFYLDIPFWANFEDFKSFGIQARVKLSKLRDGAKTTGAGMVWGGQTGQGGNWGQIRQGVIMGAIENPAQINQTFNAQGLATSDTAPDFIGWRVGASGQRRIYTMRANNTYGSYQVTAGNPAWTFPGTEVGINGAFAMSDYNDDSWTPRTSKKEAFVDQEYVFKAERNTATTWFFNVYLPDGTGNNATNGGGLLNNYDPGTAAYRKVIDEDTPMYLGFLVYGVEAEFSDIKIYYDGQVAWEDPAVKDATPTPPTAKYVNISSAPVGVPMGGNDATYEIATFPGVKLSAEVCPVTADQTVTWSLDTVPATGVLELLDQQGNIVNDPATGVEGVGTVTATPAINANLPQGVTGVTGTYKIAMVTKIPRIKKVTIDTPSKTEFEYGDKLTFTATVEKEDNPSTAPDGVTWSVVKTSGSGTTATTVPATEAIIFKDGELQAGFAATDTVIKVIATSVGYAPGATIGAHVNSDPVEITIKAFTKAKLPKVWKFGTVANGGARIPENWEATPAANDNTGTGTGVVAGGLSLISPSGGSINWRLTQASGGSAGNTILDYVGCLQPSGQGWSGTIVDFGVPVKVTIVAANTGDSDPTPARHLYIRYGSGATITSVDMPGQAVRDVSDRAYFVTTGQGAITFGSTDGSLRVFEIKVEDPDAGTRLTGITLSSESVSIAPGATAQVPTVTKVPPDATDDIVWVSPDITGTYIEIDLCPPHATFGTITGKVPTTSPILVRAQKKGDNTIRAEFAVTVESVALQSLAVLPTSVSIPQGDITEVAVTKNPPNASDEIEWVSADPGVATVNKDGVITGVAEGSTTVTVRKKSDPDNVKADVTVTVTPPVDNSFWHWKKGDPIFTTTATQFPASGDGIKLTIQSTAATTAANNHAVAPNGSMILSNARITIGLPAAPTSSVSGTTLGPNSGTYITNAELDLTKKWKLTVKWGRLGGTNLSAVLNNNSNSNQGGVLVGPTGPAPGANGDAVNNPVGLNPYGQIFNLQPDVNTPVTTAVVVDPATYSIKDYTAIGQTVPSVTLPSVADVAGNSFIQFRANSADFWIEEISLEYIPVAYYEWVAGEGPTNGTFTLSTNTSVKVNGKSWARVGSGTFTVTPADGISVATGGGRLVIGSDSQTATTTTTAPDGEFDFSVPRKITIEYADLAGSGGFQLHLNNNTTGQANSPLGSANRFLTINAANGPASDTIVYNFDPANFGNHASLAKAFLYIRTESGVTGVKIKRIKIE